MDYKMTETPARWLFSRVFVTNMMLLFFFIYPSSTKDTIHGDAQLLKTLKDSFIDQKNVISSSWFDSQTHPCNWTGIKCDDYLFVTQIDIQCSSFSPLNLPFPRLITRFKSLNRLNLSHCGFIGEICPQFWDLNKLEIVDLSDNRVTGILPPKLAKLKHLKRLILDKNKFSGFLPSEIGELKELQELSLHSNSFSGNIPNELGNLKMIQSMDISSNFFYGNLPLSLANLTRLLFFTARNNMFTGFLPQEIGRLIKLQILDLSWNSFNGTLPPDIGNLKELTILDLQNCRFTGNIPKEISTLVNLTYLNLAQNDFDGELPSCIGDLVNLVYLIAPSCGFIGQIPSQIGNCKKIKIVDLSFNSFNGSLPNELSGLESITSFLLDSNRLSGHIPAWILNWIQVRSIVLSQNLLTGPLQPLNLPMLSLLDVSSNMLSGELPEEICNAPSLARLMLSRNNFSGSINGTFRRCLNLTDLILSENNISGEVPGYLGELQLVTLELSKNKLHGNIPDQIWKSKTLMSISLNDNLLRGTLSVSAASNLERLQLDNNLFTGNIPVGIGKLKNLTNLSLHGNKLAGNIPFELFECINLVSLDLGANKLTGKIPRTISKLRLLDNLVLSDNRLSGPIPEEICCGFQKVPLPDSEYTQHYGMLDLSFNELEGIIPRSIKDCFVLKEVVLRGNKLNGSIPEEITSLPNLTLLDLSFNHFSGFLVPQLFSMMNIQGLILSHNQIKGSIPYTTLSKFTSLAKLDLSNNGLNGSLPSSLFSVKSLTYLDVSMNSLSGPLSVVDLNITGSLLVLNASNNQLSGTLDETVSNLASLSVLDLHNNTLTGSLPSSLSNLASLTYLDLSENDFQGPFPCNICTIQGLIFANFSGNSFNEYFPESCINSTPSPTSSKSSGLSHASIFGLAIGITVIFLVLIIALLKLKAVRKNNIILDKSKDGMLVMTPEPTSSDGLLRKKPKEPLSINIATFQHSLLRIKAADILSATENFSKSYIIGDGGFGTVYRASLSEGRLIAVKRLNGGHLHGEREFSAEMETIGKIKHENLVPLLGYCVFEDERLLIYEYMQNGSLDFWLRNHADAVESLDWPTRFKICKGSARGLAFLHHGFVPHIIHRDIKSSNILLDKNFEARVSDFGLARIISACESHVSTVLAGSFGYIPPEYGQSMVATTKGDVYSFGVVMLELVTGREPIGQADIEGGNLVGWVRWMVANGREDEIVDKSICGGSNVCLDQMMSVLNIAKACTHDEPWKRPTMLQVVKLLKQAKN